jgi:type I restriction enzyme S subunit
MSEWKEYRLGDLCERVTSGGTPNTRKNEYYGGEIPWVRTQEVNFNRIYDTEIKITKQGLDNSSAKWIPENSVIIAMYGATAGKVAINKIPLTTNQACCNLIIDESKADHRFIYYNILSRFSSIANMAVGGAQQNLNAGMIKDLFISTPDLPTQTAIAEILSSLDDKIELNNKINKELENLAQTLFKQWFIDFEFPNENGEPYKSSGGEMVESELGEIPKGWEVGTIESLTQKMNSGGTPSTRNADYYDGNIIWYSTKELKDNFIFDSERTITLNGLNNSSAKLFPTNTVVMAIYAAPTVGRLGILSQESAFNQAALGFVAKVEVGYEFMYLLLKYLRDDFNNLANGAAQQNLNVGLVKNFKILMPLIEPLAKFQSLMKPVFESIKNNQLENNSLTKTRDTLLPKLISGELEVSQTQTSA